MKIEPSVVIYCDGMVYMRRWYIIKTKLFSIYLNNILMSDEQPLHDHPWLFNISILLKGYYYEYTPRHANDPRRNPYDQPLECKRRGVGSLVFRRRFGAHRLSLGDSRHNGQPNSVWSLFLTGPLIQDWGFYTRRGWTSHTELLDMSAYKQGISRVKPECEWMMR